MLNSYSLDSAFQTSSEVAEWQRISSTPPSLFATFLQWSFFIVLFFFFSFYLIFLSYFCFPSFAFYFLFSFFLQSMTLFYHLLWNSVHIHPSEKLQRTNQKGVQWGIQLLSSPRKTNSSALWNCFHCSEAKSYGFCLLILVPCKEMSSGVTSRRQPTPWNSRCQFFIPSLIILWVLDTKGS